MKGRKTCPECGSVENGPRSFVCKGCNHIFAFKGKEIIKEKRTHTITKDFNWRDLQPGDRLKVAGGPFFMHGEELIPMGYRGRFVVERIDDKGICAWGTEERNSGFAHIYMGPDYKNHETGINKVKHRILKIKRKVVDTTQNTRQLT